MEDRRYTSKEFKKIMDRALRIQGRRDSNAQQGHSMSELVAIGRDLGIDEQAIREAAGEVELGGSGALSARLLGGELVQRERMDLPQEITREKAEEIASAIGHIVGLPGNASVAGRRVTWQTSFLLTQQRAWAITASVAAHGSQTRIEVESHNGMLAGGLFGGLVGGLGIGAGFGVGFGVGIGALGLPAFAIVVPTATIALAYLGSRALFRMITRGRRRRVARMAEQLADLVRSSGD